MWQAVAMLPCRLAWPPADSFGGPMTNQSRRRRVGRAPTIYDVARECRGRPLYRVPGLLAAGPGECRDRRADPCGGRPPRLPDQPAGAGPVDRPQLDGRTGHPGVTNPVYFDITRGAEDAAAEAGYTLLLADFQGVGPAGAQGDRPGSSRRGGARPGGPRISDSAIRMAAKQRPGGPQPDEPQPPERGD